MSRLEVVREWKGRRLPEPHVVIDGQLRWAIEDVWYFARQCLGQEPSVYKSGRHALFERCRLCGDPNCGAVSVKIEFDDRHVTWSDFHWEVNYSGFDEFDEPTFPLCEEGCYTFERSRYEALMDALLRQPHCWWSALPP